MSYLSDRYVKVTLVATTGDQVTSYIRKRDISVVGNCTPGHTRMGSASYIDTGRDTYHAVETLEEIVGQMERGED